MLLVSCVMAREGLSSLTCYGKCLESTQRRAVRAAAAACCALIHTTVLEPSSPSKATTEKGPGHTGLRVEPLTPAALAPQGFALLVSICPSICGVSSLELLTRRRASALTNVPWMNYSPGPKDDDSSTDFRRKALRAQDSRAEAMQTRCTEGSHSAG